MMQKPLLLLLALTSITASARAATDCPAPWSCEPVDAKIEVTHLPVKAWLHSQKTVRLRAGFIDAAADVPFRGNVLYLQGLADSMLNHEALFTRLTSEGYRVIAFDYPGQGGSEGSMNDTRLDQIPALGEQVWGRFARDTAAHPRRTLIGWSTGGLAAYLAASQGRADRVILIAPGLAPKPVFRITLATLTTETTVAGNRASDGAGDPHRDPISPVSPALVPEFAIDLLSTAAKAKRWRIPVAVDGLVLLSGDEDQYVDADRAERLLDWRAPRFRKLRFAGALHEIDNEVGPIRQGALAAIAGFLSATE